MAVSDRNGDSSAWWLGMAMFLGGWVTIASQGYYFLRDGIWTPVSILSVVRWTGKANSWAASPTEWEGLHKIIDALPLSGTAIVAGFGLMALIYAA